MIPPHPAAWREGSIILQRAEDGTLSGQIVLHDARWHFRGWRKGGDQYHILFDAQPVMDEEMAAISERLARTLGSG